MTLITIDGYEVAEEQAERFLRDRERVAAALEALLLDRYARVCRMTLEPEDGYGLAAYNAQGELAFHFPLDPGNVARAAEALAADRLADFLADCL
mgnify:FL=1